MSHTRRDRPHQASERQRSTSRGRSPVVEKQIVLHKRRTKTPSASNDVSRKSTQRKEPVSTSRTHEPLPRYIPTQRSLGTPDSHRSPRATRSVHSRRARAGSRSRSSSRSRSPVPIRRRRGHAHSQVPSERRKQHTRTSSPRPSSPVNVRRSRHRAASASRSPSHSPPPPRTTHQTRVKKHPSPSPPSPPPSSSQVEERRHVHTREPTRSSSRYTSHNNKNNTHQSTEDDNYQDGGTSVVVVSGGSGGSSSVMQPSSVAVSALTPKQEMIPSISFEQWSWQPNIQPGDVVTLLRATIQSDHHKTPYALLHGVILARCQFESLVMVVLWCLGDDFDAKQAMQARKDCLTLLSEARAKSVRNLSFEVNTTVGESANTQALSTFPSWLTHDEWRELHDYVAWQSKQAHQQKGPQQQQVKANPFATTISPSSAARATVHRMNTPDSFVLPVPLPVFSLRFEPIPNPIQTAVSSNNATVLVATHQKQPLYCLMHANTNQ